LTAWFKPPIAFCREHSGWPVRHAHRGQSLPDGTVEFVSAGHLPLLHLSCNEPAVADATGLPLGMFTNAPSPYIDSNSLPKMLARLHRRVTEAHNPDGEEYGIARMKVS